MKIILSLLLTIGILSCALSQRVIYTINNKNGALSQRVIYTINKNDVRLTSYNDSLSRYNEFLDRKIKYFEILKSVKTYKEFDEKLYNISGDKFLISGSVSSQSHDILIKRQFKEKECSCFFSSEILIDRVVWIKKVFPPDNIVILQEKPVTKSVSKPKVEVSKPRVVVEEVPVDTLKRKITWYTSYPDGTKRIDSTRTEKLAIIK
jgi:hypothetical protein